MALDDSPTKKKLEIIAMAAEGSMRDAWSLMDVSGAGQRLLEENVRTIIGSVSRNFY